MSKTSPNSNKLKIRYKEMCLVFIFYVIIVFLANWSLLLENNLMKWDIMDSYYPDSMFLSNALSNNILPIWNPTVSFGIPYYSLIGTPVWYPTTVIFALFGYPIRAVAIEYCFHVVVACFGVYLYTKQALNGRKNRKNLLAVSIIAGLFYGFSTIFLSNAQHIMIIISAAWLPYVLFFLKKYLTNGGISQLMLAAYCAGLSIMGGYPEIWIAMFIILIPFFIHYSNLDKDWRIIVCKAAGKYMLFTIFTVLASAITIVPFALASGSVTRIGGMGTIINSLSPTALWSMIIPRFTVYAQETILIDRSMINMYMGLLTVISIPFALFTVRKGNKFNLVIVFFSLFMIFGNNTFVHSIFYRFFPGFSSLRFPTTWRCIFVFFLLEVMSIYWYEILENKESISKLRKGCNIVSGVLLALGLGVYLLELLKISDVGSQLSETFIIASILFLFYGIAFKYLQSEIINIASAGGILVFVVLIDILSYHYIEMPVTITEYTATESLYNEDVKEKIEYYCDANRKRNKSVEFKNAKRSDNGINEYKIVIDRTLDEEGYISVKNRDVQHYKQTVNRNIIKENSVIYFTDNIVSTIEEEFEIWSNDISVLPTQIYIDNPMHKIKEQKTQSIGQIDNEEIELAVTTNIDRKTLICGDFKNVSDSTYFRKLRLYLSGDLEDKVILKLEFITDDDKIEEFTSDKFKVCSDKKGKYINIYFPSSSNYKILNIEMKENINVQQSEFVVAPRITRPNNVILESFKPNSVRISADVESDGYLVLLQSFHFGWKVYIDGKEESIEKVNRAFMGVFLTDGKHQIEFKFEPIDFYLSGIISILYLCTMIIVLVNESRHKART